MRLNFLIFRLVFTLACGVLPQLVIGCASNTYVTPNAIFDFASSREKDETEYRARHGDAKAANRMAEYCYFIEKSRTKAIHWYRVAASYGDQNARQNANKLSEIE
jgi:hypothetical protein